jgi:hypothetical protein
MSDMYNIFFAEYVEQGHTLAAAVTRHVLKTVTDDIRSNMQGKYCKEFV